MRDDQAKWQPALDLDGLAFRTSRMEMSVVRPERQTLISGPFADAMALAGHTKAVGWPEPVAEENYALSMRRDAILVVNGPSLEEGWHPKNGLAVSDMTGGYSVIELMGPGAFAVLQRGTEITMQEKSGSVLRLFHGYTVLLYTHIEVGRFRLHIPRAHFDGLWSLVEHFAKLDDD